MSRYSLLLLAFVLAVQVRANGLRIRITEVEYPRVRLSVAWQNGWGYDARIRNHDAVWLFAKGENSHGDGFAHLMIGQVQVGSGRFRDSLPPDRAGLFIIPAHHLGFQEDSCSIEIVLEGLAVPASIRLYGVEMVYQPRGSYLLGDGASNFSFVSATDSTPKRIEPGVPLAFGDAPGDLAILGGETGTFQLPSAWPQGAEGFYLMKYELSQRQYLDFYNSLSRTQREAVWARRGGNGSAFALDAGPHRNALRRNAEGFLEFAGDGEHVACNYLAWADLLAWLDWAALRPMTELEFEKACRGPLAPQPKEFAWGTQLAFNVVALADSGTGAEAPLARANSPQTGNAVYGGLFGQTYLNSPVRQGFAATDSSDRASSGAGFYGAFELSGSLWEMCVKATNTASGFTQAPGDGSLDSQGNQNQNWPAAAAAITRGGGCNSLILNNLNYQFRDLATSDRFYHALPPDQRLHTVGGRGAR